MKLSCPSCRLVLCIYLYVPLKIASNATTHSYQVPTIVKASAAAGRLAAGTQTVSDDVMAAGMLAAGT